MGLFDQVTHAVESTGHAVSHVVHTVNTSITSAVQSVGSGVQSATTYSGHVSSATHAAGGTQAQVAAAHQAATIQHQLLDKYVWHRATKDAASTAMEFHADGTLKQLKGEPVRAIGESLDHAVKRIRGGARNYFSENQLHQIAHQNAKGTVVPLKHLAKIGSQNKARAFAGAKAKGKAASSTSGGLLGEIGNFIGGSRASAAGEAIGKGLGAHLPSLHMPGEPSYISAKPTVGDVLGNAALLVGPELAVPKLAEALGALRLGGRAAESAKSASQVLRHPLTKGIGAPSARELPAVLAVAGKGKALALGTGAAAEHAGTIGATAGAFGLGTAEALQHNPLKVFETTGRGAVGIAAAPAALVGAGIKSALEGSTDPLAGTAGALGSGTLSILGHLASANPATVEHSVLTEAGLTPFIPLPHLLARTKLGDLIYREPRAAVRALVEKGRSARREKAIAQQREAVAGNRFTGRQKEVKHSVESSRHPGQFYAITSIGRKVEESRQHHSVAAAVTRIKEFGTHWGNLDARPITKALRGRPGNRSPLVTQDPIMAADAVKLLAQHGVARDPVVGLAYVKELLASYGKAEFGKAPAGALTDRHAAQWIVDHPQVFSDSHVWKAVEAFKKQAETVGYSERHRWLAASNVVNRLRAKEGKPPILLPEERITATAERLLPKGVPHTRTAAFEYLRKLKDEKKAKLAKALEGLMRPPEFGGPRRGVVTTKAKPYTAEMVNAFTREMAAEHTARGFSVPAAYVADIVPQDLGGPTVGGAKVPVPKGWPASGHGAWSGNALSSFEHTLANSVHAPRMRRALNEGLSNFFARHTEKVNGARYHTAAEASRLINTHQIDLKQFVPIRTQMFKEPLTGPNAISHEEWLAAAHAEALHGEQVAAGERSLAQEIGAKGHMPGEKVAFVARPALAELLGQLDQPGGKNSLGKPTASAAQMIGKYFGRPASRTILNDPGWVFSQLFATGFPIAAALGKDLVRAPKAIRTLAEIQKLSHEDQARIMSITGSGMRIIGGPASDALRSIPETSVRRRMPWSKEPVRTAAKQPLWRPAWALLNGEAMGRWDRFNNAYTRELGAVIKADSGMRGFGRGLRGLYKNEEQAAAAMKGMTPAERLAYIAKHPRLGPNLQKAMNDIGGNWDVFTNFERAFAPFTVFYSFLRFSMNWMFHTFPLGHPVAATALAFLAQQNSNELEKIAGTHGQALADPLGYAFPAIVSAPGKVTPKTASVLPIGSRISPGLSAFGQVAVTGQPSQLLGALSPGLSIGLSAIQGVDPFTGQPLSQSRISYVADQIISLSPWARLAGVNRIGIPPSSLHTAFQKLDPLAPIRSALAPGIPLSGTQFALKNKLENGLTLASDNSKAKVFAAAQGGASKAELAKMQKLAQHGQEQIKQVLTKLGLEKLDQQLYQQTLNKLPSTSPSSSPGISTGGSGGISPGISGSSSPGIGALLPVQQRKAQLAAINKLGVSKAQRQKLIAALPSASISASTGLPVNLPKTKQSPANAKFNRSWPRANAFSAGAAARSLPFNTIAAIAESAGLPGVTFAQVAQGEGVMQPGADGGLSGTSGPAGYGLWQITPAVQSQSTLATFGKIAGGQTAAQMAGPNPAYFNPVLNARMAKVLYDSGGLGGWYGTSHVTDPNAHYTGNVPNFGAPGQGTVVAAASPFGPQVAKQLQFVKAGQLSKGPGTITLNQSSVNGGVVNIVKGHTPEIVARLKLLSAKIGQPIYIESGYRTPAQSQAVGGFANDPHTQGLAVDTGPNVTSISEATLNSVGLTRPFPTAGEMNHIQLQNPGSPIGAAAPKTTPYTQHYTHPFSQKATRGRADQGIDFTVKGGIRAMGRAKVLAHDFSQWPGGGGVLYQLLDGPQKGKAIYVAEDVSPTVQPGKIVPAGQVIATANQGGWLEMGFYNPAASHPYKNIVAPGQPAQGQRYTVANSDGQVTLGSKEFAQFLNKVNAGVVVVPTSGGGTPSYGGTSGTTYSSGTSGVVATSGTATPSAAQPSAGQRAANLRTQFGNVSAVSLLQQIQNLDTPRGRAAFLGLPIGSVPTQVQQSEVDLRLTALAKELKKARARLSVA